MGKNLKTKIVFLGLLGIFIVTTGFRCTLLSQAEKQLLKPVELSWWGVEDDADAYSDVINAYKIMHPNIGVNYRRLRAEEFETELLNALAEDRGPDIFSIRNTWVTKYLTKIETLPAKTTMAYEVKQKSLGVKQETIVEVRDTKSITPAKLAADFIEVVAKDVVRGDKIYGLPLSVDTLALFYNKDLFNAAGIPLPPKTWPDLQADVKKLTFQDNSGQLIQAGAGLGTANNIDYFADILALLMMQNGARMASGSTVTFGSLPPGLPGGGYNPGPQALVFYTDFANSGKEVYTWNDTFPNSTDAFAQGRLAMMFGYHSDIEKLQAKRQGKLNFGLAKAPQIANRPADINFARYWVQTVSNKSKNINEAWDFVQFISQEAQAKQYLAKTGKPTALRSVVVTQTEDDKLQVFADQLLTAQSWYQGNDSTVVDSAFGEMVKTVLTGGQVANAIKLATEKIQQTL